MKWTILALGKLKERYLAEGVSDFLKRLGPYRPVVMVELPDEKLDEKDAAGARLREAERLRAAIKPGATVVALSERGEQVDSVVLARKLQALEADGGRELVFVIGSASGLDPAFEAAAHWRLGLSRLTLPHQMARLLLVEQLYRCERIRRNEPYHK